jgi:hypothetical protein
VQEIVHEAHGVGNSQDDVCTTCVHVNVAQDLVHYYCMLGINVTENLAQK